MTIKKMNITRTELDFVLVGHTLNNKHKPADRSQINNYNCKKSK